MNTEDIFRCPISCEIMLMIKARIRLKFCSAGMELFMQCLAEDIIGFIFMLLVLLWLAVHRGDVVQRFIVINSSGHFVQRNKTSRVCYWLCV